MMKNIQTIEKKILTIKKISKITKAMKVIAIMKGKKIQKKFNTLKEHLKLSTEIFSVIEALKNQSDFNKNRYHQKINHQNVYILFTSDLGLCGSFNTRIFETLTTKISKKTKLIIIGSKGLKHFQYLNYQILKNFSSNKFLEEGLLLLVSFLKEFYQKNPHTNFFVLYTEVANYLPLKTKFFKILPLSLMEEKKEFAFSEKITSEMKPLDFFNFLLPLFLQTILHFFYVQSRLSEEKTRQFAMDTANENAKEMLKELQVQYNQIRQEKITKEILLVSQES